MQYANDNKVKSLPSTPWRLCVSLFQGTYLPHQMWEGKRFRNKFFLRSLVMPFSTHKILKLITEHPHSEKLMLAQPRLPCRLHRPYLSNRLSRRDGASAIFNHYKIIDNFMGETAFIKHLDNSLCLAQFEGKSKALYCLKFVSTHRLDREGEASLILTGGDGGMLCEITFTICEHSGKQTLMIGGLQGPNSIGAQEKVQLATKDFHGVFPKKLVYETLVFIAKKLNIHSISAVSNETHVYQSLRYHSRQKKMHANYNGFWEMMGGVQSSDGNYILDCHIARKNIESIASKKRSEYRRRYDLLDGVLNGIEISLECFQ